MYEPRRSVAAILAATADDNVDGKRLASLVAQDPALFQRLLDQLRLFHGKRNEPTLDVGRVVTMLGPRTVECVAIEVVLVEAVRAGGLPAASAALLWSECLRRAAAARFLAEHLGKPLPDVAFCAGFALEIGSLWMLSRMGTGLEWADQVRARAGAERIAAERSLFGRSHVDAFKEMSITWKLPRWLVSAVELHHSEGRLSVGPDELLLRDVLARADAIGPDLASPESGADLSSWVAGTMTSLSLDEPSAWSIASRVLSELVRIAPAVGLDVPPQPTLDQLRARTATTYYDDPAVVAERVELVREENAVLKQRLLEAHGSLERVRRSDPVSGALTYAAFLERTDAEVREAVRTGRPIGVTLIDLDRFADVNLSLGVATGDLLLRRVAELLKHVNRGLDLIGRVGPDSFAVVLAADERAGKVHAERLRGAIESLALETLRGKLRPTARAVFVTLHDVTGGPSGVHLLRAAEKRLAQPAEHDVRGRSAVPVRA